MSYILEALKKSQAERQLGNAPTIHAPSLHHAPARLPAVKKTSLLALGAGAVAIAGAGWFAWSQRAPAPAVLTAAPPAAVPAAVPAPVALAPAPAPTPVPTPAPAAVVPRAPVVVARTEPAVRPRKAPAAPVVAAAPAPAEENLHYARDLPQDVQQQLPRVSFGGYMYSDNAADRLVLVDKTLRHEGEEIAPGLMLEKLLPKGAVLNYRGTRYRVGF